MQEDLIQTFKADGGYIPNSILKQLTDYIRLDTTNTEYKLKVTKARSLSQNKILHKLIEEWRLKMIREGNDQFQQGEHAKKNFKRWLDFGSYEIVTTKTGRKAKEFMPKKSSDLSKRAFSSLLKQVYAQWIDEFNEE